MTNSFDRHIIRADASLRNALEQLNRLSGSEMTLFAVDNADRRTVLGTLTDGDVRRALLCGAALDSPITEAMFCTFKYLRRDAADCVDQIRDIRAQGITLVPQIDDQGRLYDILDLSKTTNLLPLNAILMAGGVGERLRPMTLSTPKPLLQIDGKAIIDYNVEALARVGITDITVCTRYLADQIHDHFSCPVAGVDVKCVTEQSPLGTMGAASLVSRGRYPDTLVMNSDLLTTVSFEDMYLCHRDNRADITVAVIPYQVSVPYAILTTSDDNIVTGVEEKPAYSYYANAGIYIFSNAELDAIPANTHIDATDLINNAIQAGKRVVYHPVNGTWIDVGTPVDFRHATELMRHYRNLSGR